MLDQLQRPSMRWTWFIVPAGIILPAISITVESTTHICAGHFFDPIPTLWHVLLVVFVPLAHLQVWRAIRRQELERSTVLGVTNSIAVGISIFYTLVYIPLLPLAAIALAFFGIGVLPLAPLFSLITGLILRRQLSRGISNAPNRSFWLRTSGLFAGIAIAFCFIALAELPATLTRFGLQMAASDSPAKSARGIRFLRRTGDRDALLRACYMRTGRATDLIGYLFSAENPVAPEDARKIYYRVTGQTFDMSPPPSRLNGRWLDLDDIEFDRNQGNTISRIKGLTLGGSQMDGSADADGGLAYLEWTLVFRNDSNLDHEARAQIQLPPGGVVSRVSLLIDGSWREAAFAGRTRVQQAYQLVVSQRRDPVLVTTSGRDRILVQCFPVPSNGIMKVRLGITAPLLLENLGYERLLLPRLIERNFGIAEDLKHAVWIESNAQLESQSDGLTSELPLTSLHALRGAINDRELSMPESSIRLARSAIRESWTRSSVNGKNSIVHQTVQERPNTGLSRVIVVIDTSRRMRDSALEISNALQVFPENVKVNLLFAGGNGLYEDHGTLAAGNTEQLASWIRSVSFDGGVDNVPALIRAWDVAAENPETDAIIWIHSPQPIQLQSVDSLRQRWDRRPNGPTLYSIQTSVGPDRVEAGLDGIGAVRSVPRFGNLQADLKKLFAELSGLQKTYEYVRSNEIKEDAPDAVDAKETSSHLARLWANDEVNRLLAATNDTKATDEATQLAVQYQLVTPVSGAVVLETQEQYRAAGLEPVAPGTVPTIPEPGMIVLIAVATGILLLALSWQRVLRKKRPRVTL